MSPEFGSTMGFFPVDDNTIEYLKLTGRSDKRILEIETYLKNNMLFRSKENEEGIDYTQVVELDLSEIVPVVAGPRRP